MTAGMPMPYTTAIPMTAVRSMSSAISTDSPLHQTGNTEESRSDEDIYSHADHESINVITPRQPTAGADIIFSNMKTAMGDEHEMNLEESHENSCNDMYETNDAMSVDAYDNALPIAHQTAGHESDEDDDKGLYGKGKGNTVQ